MPRKETYPWDVWFNGKEYQLQRGIDFNIPVDYFQSTVYRTLKRKGLNGNFRAQIVDENTVIISPSNNLIVYERAELIGREVSEEIFHNLAAKSNRQVKRKSPFELQYPKVAELFIQVQYGNKGKHKIKKPKIDLETGKEMLLIDLKDENGNYINRYNNTNNKAWVMEEVEYEYELPEEIILYYPNDIPVSPKVAASKIRNAAVSYFADNEQVDPTKWNYIWDDVKLTIQFGKLGLHELNRKLEREREEREYEQSLIKDSQDNLIPITTTKLDDWFEKLKQSQNGVLTLLKGRDYSCSSERAKTILYRYGQQVGLRLYEAVLTAEKDGVTLNIGKFDPYTKKGVGYDESYVNIAAMQIKKNNSKILKYKRKLQTAIYSNTQKAIDDFIRRIEELEQENKLLETPIETEILQPSDIQYLEEQEERKRLELEEKQAEEDRKRIALDVNSDPYSLPSQQNLLTAPQPRIYTIPELQQKIQLAKQKNNVTALRIFREKLALLGGKEE